MCSSDLLVGGLIGCLLIGVFADSDVNAAGSDGLLFGGGFTLLGKQALGSFAVLAYSFVVTGLIGLALDRTLGMRISRDAEMEGIDLALHLESAYDFEGRTSGGMIGASAGSNSTKGA